MKRINVKNTAVFVTILIVAVAVIVAAPLVVIWALNTLFNTGIAYGFWEWLSIVVLSSVINGSNFIKIERS